MKEKFIYPILFLLLGIAYLFVLPAFTAPDERDHFATAYFHVNELLGYQQNRISQTEGGAYYDIPMRDSDYQYCVLNDAAKSYKNVGNFQSEGLESVYTGKVMPYPSVLYFPAMLGILLGRLCGLQTYFMIVFARMLNLFAGAALILYAVGKLRKNDLKQPAALIMVLSCMPITLHLLASYSSDAMVIGCGFLVVSYLLVYQLKDKTMTMPELILLTLALSIFSASKPIYAACVFFAFLFPKRCFSKLWQRMVLFVVPALVWIAFYGGTVVKTVSGGAVSAYTDANGYTMQMVLANPVQVTKLILTSMIKQLPYIVLQKFGLYLGSLDIRIPTICVLLGLLVFFMVWMCGWNKKELILKTSEAVKMIVMFFLVYGCCYGMELFWWTSVTDTQIGGIQGRYFLPLFPMLMFAVMSFFTGKLAQKNWINQAVSFIEKGKAFLYPVLIILNIAALFSVYKMFSI